jgi:hypothetical protein
MVYRGTGGQNPIFLFSLKLNMGSKGRDRPAELGQCRITDRNAIGFKGFFAASAEIAAYIQKCCR